MAAFRTLNLLPSVFRTKANSKFLNATLDQLVAEPSLERINGYIGRRVSGEFQSQNKFIQEPSSFRQNYQLEPSLVIEQNSVVDFNLGYLDFINQIRHQGGNNQNHSRLFENEYYSFDGLFDFDKFVNFNQYYWVPNGPDAVDVVLESGTDIETDLLGKNSYTTENSVVLTAGLKIRFDNTVVPSSYRNTEYYVEGVGTGIVLIPVDNLVTPELDSTVTESPDYVTISRASQDLNAWTRSNRWFHIDVLTAAAEYRSEPVILNQSKRALRPIIEFQPNIRLFDSGTTYKAPVDLVDDFRTDVFSQLEGLATNTFIDGIELQDGMRVIFTADPDPLVKNKIYQVNFIDPDATSSLQIHLSLVEDSEPSSGDTVSVLLGTNNAGRVLRFTGSEWVDAQKKITSNQAPRFDVFDAAGTSFSDQLKYPNNNFTGTKIFSYKTGSGKADSVLGFALSYRNISNIGDIVFDNNFDQDIFRYTQSNETREVRINSGFLQANNQPRNIWTRVSEPSFQYQVLSYDVSGTRYLVDVEPVTLGDPGDLKVYLDNKKLSTLDYTFTPAGKRSQLDISESEISGKSRVDIFIRSRQVSTLGYYQIPVNLEFNAKNDNFENLTLGQMRGHVQKIYDNTPEATGVFPGSGNLRDLGTVKTNPGTILQHSAGLPYAMLFLSNQQLNFVSAVQQASFDYSKFKYRFLDQASNSGDIDLENIPASLDEIIKTLNDIKTPDFPYYASDMVPYGEKTVFETELFGQTQFQLPEVFDLSKPSFQAVLVYLNGSQLVVEQDYFFNTTTASLVLSDNLTVLPGDRIRIEFFESTLGCWIPETPTKLGLWPRYRPEIIQDDTLLNPVNMILGHDGSLTPAFGDFRDQMLLELEKRIYNNIKATHDLERVNIFDIRPSKSRNTGYELSEVNQILSSQFFKWTGANRLNYSKNTIFDLNNPFTYNYKRSTDRLDNSILPGSWRAVFEYYFDTARPHTHPWEMLGFSEKPNWWETEYGTAPYTSANTALWQDLSAGVIAAGERAGTDPRFARDYLLDMIPVDSAGNLRSPADFIVKINTPTSGNISWAVGDQGPVETAWRRSSEFPFAVQLLLALAKPARYFGENIDIELYKKSQSLDQFIFSKTNQRMLASDLEITGEVKDHKTISKLSYINWVADYIRSQGRDPVRVISEKFNNFEIRLSYKMAAYSDKKYLKVFAEQVSPTSVSDSIVVPDEDYRVYLQTSAPLDKIRYSGVLVTKTSTGYRIDGLDINRPYFTIVPSQVNNNSYAVSVMRQTGIVYRDYQKILINIPYGYEFATRQQVFDFLVSYGRYLNSQGFVFTEQLADLTDARNWILSGKEFLFWSQQGWPANSMIFLSPVGTRIKLRTRQATVGEIQDSRYASRVLDQNLRIITRENYTVNRQSNEFTLETAGNQIIGFAEFDAVQFEHALIFKNSTMFNDIIYAPEQGSRQLKMRLVGFRTSNWSGTLEPAGFVLNQDSVSEWQAGQDYVRGALVRYKNQYYTAIDFLAASDRFEFANWKQLDYSGIKKGLIPNFANSAENFETFYDVNGINLENQFDLLGKGLIGYRPRQYFTDIGIDDTSQVKFYQGFIREKGTPRSFEALLGAEFDNISTDIQTREEWAIRIGEYGAVDSRQVIEVQLDEQKFSANPSTIRFISESEAYPITEAGYKPSDLYRKPGNQLPDVFRNLEVDQAPDFEIKTAGYLQVADVDFTLYDLRDYVSLEPDFDLFGLGKTIWVARDFSADWNVFRITETNAKIRRITNQFDQTVLLVTDVPHGLNSNDLIVINNSLNGTVFNGVHRVLEILTSTEFLVEVPENLFLDDFQETEPEGALYKLVSLRFNQPQDIVLATPLNGWRSGEKFFVDQFRSSDHWAVFEKNQPWTNSYNYTDNQANTQRGTAVAVSEQSQHALIGSAEFNTGEVLVLFAASRNVLRERYKLTLNANDVQKFGSAIALKKSIGVIGAPGSAFDRGFVTVVNLDLPQATQILQVFTTPDAELSGRFGQALAISSDSAWIYIAAPGINRVYAYKQLSVPTTAQKSKVILGDGSSAIFDLGFTPESENSLIVKNSLGGIYIPGRDYNLLGSDIVFDTVPDLGEYIVATQGSIYYKHVATITAPDSSSGDNFGHSIACSADGSRLIVGAPYHEYAEPPGDSSDLTDVGSVYIFDRSVEAFYGSGSIYQSSVALTPNLTVRKNQTVLIENQDYIVNLITDQIQVIVTTEPYDKIYLETNNFVLVDKFKSQTPARFNNFGYSVAICGTDCSFYVGSPSTDSNATNSGSVYRYINSGKIYGVVTGNTVNPVLTPGDKFRINDFTITVPSSAVDSLINLINNLKISGVSARNHDNKIQITTTSDSDYNKLRISPVSGTVLSDLGIEIYNFSQMIENPHAGKNEYFGETLALSPDSKKLFVGSPSATSRFIQTLDQGNTTFDVDSTRFQVVVENSGSVQVFELLADATETADNPGKMAFGQKLISNTLSTSDRFGHSIAVGDSVVLIGAPSDSTLEEKQGIVNFFVNSSGKNCFELLRERTPRVDISGINRVLIYNKKTNRVTANLDFIDPVKGKLLGGVLQNLDYVTPYDPARYNQSAFSEVAVSEKLVWGPAQVGTFWWNLETLRFLDYEQAGLDYRSANWGKLFPGSQVEIYEWIESLVLPSEFQSQAGAGTPKNIDNSEYSQVEYQDPETGAAVIRYYFWVKNRSSISDGSGKTLTSSQVASCIENPQSQSIPYAAFLRSDAVSVFNTGSEISNDTVIHIDYDVKINDNNLHKEFELIQENSADSRPSKKILDKFQDSLSGINAQGSAVPDTALSAPDQLGILFRPRQSVFLNRIAALRVLITEVNRIFLREKIAEDRDLVTLNQAEPAPKASSGAWDESVASLSEFDLINFDIKPLGYRVLVESSEDLDGRWCIFVKRSATQVVILRVQSFDVRRYWTSVDWYATGYSAATIPDHVVANRTELVSLAVTENDIVRVLDNGRSQFLLLRATDTGTGPEYETVGVQRGTIQLLKTLYENPLTGFDAAAYEAGLFDESLPQIEVRYIFDALRNDILINDLAPEFNRLFFILLKYAVSEQPGLDWAFKTSFISVIHKIRKLEEYPTFRRDNQQFVLDYLTEAKPYRTKIREYVLDYERTDISNTVVTDFDKLDPDTYQDWADNYDLEDSPVRSGLIRIKFDRINYAWDLVVRDWEPNTAYQENDIITRAGIAYLVKTGFTSGARFSLINLETYAAEDFESALDRTWAYYQPRTGDRPRDLKLLFSGLEYPGTFVNAPAFTESTGFDTRRWDRDLFDSVTPGSDTLPDNVLDNTIQSSFTDTNLGLRPEDVILEGAAFVDTFNSHSPEELVPGQCFDTLDLQVYTTENTDISQPAIAFRIFHNMIDEREYLRIADANITELAEPLNITDTEISVVDASVLAEPDPTGTVSIPGIVFINGERITYFVRDLVENKLKQIRRGTFGTGAAVTHAAGSVVVEAHRRHRIPNASDIVWMNIVPGGQLAPDGSTLIVETTGSGLQGSSTVQANFLLGEPGPVIT